MVTKVEHQIDVIDEAFKLLPVINEHETFKLYRGMPKPYSNLEKVGDKITVPTYTSTSVDFGVALIFSGLQDCCLYEFTLDKGVPYIDMVNTTIYKSESEILLPRNIIFKIEKISNHVINNFFYTNKIIKKYHIRVSLPKNSVFRNIIKEKDQCKHQYMATLNSIVPKSSPPKSSLPKSSPPKSSSSKKYTRCPNGSRRNKITKKCEKKI